MGESMLLRWGSEMKIEDLRNHPQDDVISLKKLLAAGARVVPDPKRLGFYEVESDSLVYYIYAPPAVDKIVLLATWPQASALAGCCTAA
jgi:hypothetical protein